MFVTAKFRCAVFSNRQQQNNGTQNLELRITLYFKINKIHTLCFTYYLARPTNLYATFPLPVVQSTLIRIIPINSQSTVLINGIRLIK